MGLIIDMLSDGHRLSMAENGEDIFYPWFYPGEAFLVTPEIKSRLVFKDCMTLLALFLLLSGVVCGEYFGLISVDALGISLGFITNAYFLMLFLVALDCKKKCRLYPYPLGSRPKKGVMFGWLLLLLPMQAIWLILSSQDIYNPITLLLLLLLSISSSVIAFTFYRIMKTRGYLFENMIKKSAE